jgi:hypothetical protein
MIVTHRGAAGCQLQRHPHLTAASQCDVHAAPYRVPQPRGRRGGPLRGRQRRQLAWRVAGASCDTQHRLQR